MIFKHAVFYDHLCRHLPQSSLLCHQLAAYSQFFVHPSHTPSLLITDATTLDFCGSSVSASTQQHDRMTLGPLCPPVPSLFLQILHIARFHPFFIAEQYHVCFICVCMYICKHLSENFMYPLLIFTLSSNCSQLYALFSNHSSLFNFKPIKTSFCCPNTLGYVAFHWNQKDLPGATLLEKTDCSSPRN